MVLGGSDWLGIMNLLVYLGTKLHCNYTVLYCTWTCHVVNIRGQARLGNVLASSDGVFVHVLKNKPI